MEQLREVVRQSVTMAGELQGSAEGLHRQSDVLAGVGGGFRTGRDSAGAPADATPDFRPYTPGPAAADGGRYRLN